MRTIAPDAPRGDTAAPGVSVQALFPWAVGVPPHGEAEVRSHHGEIVQGMFYSSDGTLEHALVTLPCPLFRTRARFRPTASGPLTVHPAGRGRARTAARATLDALGRTAWGGAVRLETNIPLCWGCGSSTADVLATIRAVAAAFGVTLEPAALGRLAVSAETASDSLMFAADRAVLFAQRRGTVLADLHGPLPAVRVLGFNTERSRGVETLALPPIQYSDWEIEAFQPMLGLLRRAVEREDPSLLGRVATASTVLTQRHRPKRDMPALLRLAKDVGALGVQVAHSGTVAGFLFDPGPRTARRLERARAGLRRLGVDASWEFSPDAPPPEEVE